MATKQIQKKEITTSISDPACRSIVRLPRSADGKSVVQKQMLTALVRNKGNVMLACVEVEKSREEHQQWMQEDEVYRSIADSTIETAIDHVEAKLFERIDAGDMRAIIFYLTTIGKRRGYTDKQGAQDKGNNSDEPKPDLSRLSNEELTLLAALEDKMYATEA